MNNNHKKIYEVFMVIIIWLSLVLRFVYLLRDNSIPELSWRIMDFFFYFTIESNMIAGIYFIFTLIVKDFSRKNHPLISGAVLLYVLIAGLVYITMLSGIDTRTGIDFKTANLLLHYINPLGVIFYWLFFIKKENFKWIYSILWLTFPLVYFFIAFFKGIITGNYQYPFMNVVKLGYTRVIIIGLVITLILIVLGVLFVAANRLLCKYGIFKNDIKI